jgi:hypothetical protein
MNVETLKKVNKYIFLFLVVLAVAVIGFSVYSLLIPSDAPDAGQSKLGFGWTMFHTIFLLSLLILSFLLYKFWNKFFLANIPLAIVLLGFYFFFIIITIMTGWTFLLALSGAIFALICAICLMIGNYVYVLIDDYRGAKE